MNHLVRSYKKNYYFFLEWMVQFKNHFFFHHKPSPYYREIIITYLLKKSLRKRDLYVIFLITIIITILKEIYIWRNMYVNHADMFMTRNLEIQPAAKHRKQPSFGSSHQALFMPKAWPKDQFQSWKTPQQIKGWRPMPKDPVRSPVSPPEHLWEGQKD